MPLETRPSDIVDHLGSEAALAAYLDACLEDGNPKLVGAALGDIARAKGITDLAERTGLPEAELHASLSGEQVADFATAVKAVAALGLRLAQDPVPLAPLEPGSLRIIFRGTVPAKRGDATATSPSSASC